MIGTPGSTRRLHYQFSFVGVPIPPRDESRQANQDQGNQCADQSPRIGCSDEHDRIHTLGPAVQGAGVLDERVGLEEAGQVRIVDATVHVDDAVIVHMCVAGIAAGSDVEHVPGFAAIHHSANSPSWFSVTPCQNNTYRWHQVRLIRSHAAVQILL